MLEVERFHMFNSRRGETGPKVWFSDYNKIWEELKEET